MERKTGTAVNNVARFCFLSLKMEREKKRRQSSANGARLDGTRAKEKEVSGRRRQHNWNPEKPECNDVRCHFSSEKMSHLCCSLYSNVCAQMQDNTNDACAGTEVQQRPWETCSDSRVTMMF